MLNCCLKRIVNKKELKKNFGGGGRELKIQRKTNLCLDLYICQSTKTNLFFGVYFKSFLFGTPDAIL